jgi:polyisoprenoid-binding protein YceI
MLAEQENMPLNDVNAKSSLEKVRNVEDRFIPQPTPSHMKSLILLTVLILLPFGAQGQVAQLWQIDAAHSAVNFKIRHFFTPIPGAFTKWDGVIRFDAANLAGSSIDVLIDVTSINTKNDRRDAHLRTPDFFDATTHPTIRFKSERIVKTGDNTFAAHGTLSMKDVTKPFTLPFIFLGSMPHPRGGTVAGFKAESQLLRNDFGVGTGGYIETSTIGNEVDIEILLELIAR